MTTENSRDDAEGREETATSKPGWKIVTLRIPPDMHDEAKRLAGTLQSLRGVNMSLNSLINEALLQYLKRHRNPKMIRDFVDS